MWVLFLVAWMLVLSVRAALPQRIISSMPSITEMLFALDLGDRVVGVTTNCNYPPEALKKEKVGGFFLNLEKVVSLKPDLIIMLEDAQKREIKRFKDYGLPVYTINPHTVAEVMNSLLELGKVTGKEKKAKVLVAGMRRRLRIVVLKRPRVLAVVGYNPLIVGGGGTFIDDVINYAGAENITGKAKAAYPQYSFEKLLEENPEYIIIPEGVVKREEIERDNRWQSLKAVKNNKILFINADILSRPGPRVVEAVEEIAKFIRIK